MSPQLTLTYADEHGQMHRIPILAARFHIGRSPDNDLAISDSNLSRRHALIELRGDIAYLSDLGSQNGTMVNDRSVTGAVVLADGDTITLGGARRLRVTIVREDAIQETASGVSAQTIAAPPSSRDVPVWLSPPALAAAGVVMILVCATVILLFSLGGNSETSQSTPDEPLAAAVADEIAAEIADENSNTSKSARRPSVGSSDTVSGGANATGASIANSDLGVDLTQVAPTVTTATIPDTNLSADEQITRLAKRVMSRISTDDTPYISTAGVADVRRQVEAYRGSTSLASRFRQMKSSCGEVVAGARGSNLKPSLVTLAALAQSETGGDPATVARQMMPKLLTLRATFGTETANSTLLLVAAYPYPFDPPLGSQTRTPHPLASKLMQYGGRQSTVDTGVARSVWFLRERGGITPEAYTLVVRLLAIGIIAQDPPRYGVQAEPLLC